LIASSLDPVARQRYIANSVSKRSIATAVAHEGNLAMRGLVAAFAMMGSILAITGVRAEEPAVHFYNSEAARAAKPPFSQAVRVGDVLYLSGNLGNVPGTLQLIPGGMEAEAKQTMENIGAVLKANDLGFDDVFKCTVMMADMSKWGAFNKVYVTYFKPEHLPVRSAFGANGLALGAQVEVECWAYVGKR
jgi:2-iminobutanoate/2-iminopropanoate deaminase